MRVLVLGSGGREHALCWRIARSPLVEEVVCAPGSDGIGEHARCVAVDPMDRTAVVELVKREGVQLVVVGPEDPLAAGIADAISEIGVPVFGPSAAAARLEASKSFSKSFMARHGIPTARCEIFDDADAAEAYVRAASRPLVVKADGLAAGKGVAMCEDAAAAVGAIRETMRESRFGEAGARVVIEEWLRGEEASFYAISDGERFVCLAAAQDHKRAHENDTGENTGGMGAYAPAPVVDAAVERRIREEVVRPVIEGMRAEGHPFRGVLYCGLMIADGVPSVIEFNVRFGDPETQALMLGLEVDLVPLLLGAAEGRLPEHAPALAGCPAACVVLASGGYPRAYARGKAITGLERAAAMDDVVVFHAGSKREGDGWVTNGGRVLGVTATGETLAEAVARAYTAVDMITVEGGFCRRDIAARA